MTVAAAMTMFLFGDIERISCWGIERRLFGGVGAKDRPVSDYHIASRKPGRVARWEAVTSLQQCASTGTFLESGRYLFPRQCIRADKMSDAGQLVPQTKLNSTPHASGTLTIIPHPSLIDIFAQHKRAKGHSICIPPTDRR